MGLTSLRGPRFNKSGLCHTVRHLVIAMKPDLLVAAVIATLPLLLYDVTSLLVIK